MNVGIATAKRLKVYGNIQKALEKVDLECSTYPRSRLRLTGDMLSDESSYWFYRADNNYRSLTV